jgi:hypothetical protein
MNIVGHRIGIGHFKLLPRLNPQHARLKPLVLVERPDRERREKDEERQGVMRFCARLHFKAA